MKSIAAAFLIAPYMSWLCSAQPIKLTGLDRTGNLTWTNLICTTQPVYEVLKAHSVEGSWDHVVFVTNHARVSISNVLNTVTGAAFFRLAWVDEPPLVFDYAFTESEFGLTTVTGRLELVFAGPTNGRRSFAPTEYYELSRRIHPISDAPLALGRRPYSSDGTSLQVFIAGAGGEGSVYLDGALDRSEAGGRCAYTRYSGTVWFVGFQTEAIGTFIATRIP